MTLATLPPNPPGLRPLAKSATYTAVGGELIITTNSFTITLPPPNAGRVVGVTVADARTGAAPVTIATPTGVIVGEGIGTNSVGASSMVLGIEGAYVVLEADGTNWRVIAGAQDTGHIAFPFSATIGNLSGHVCSYRKIGDQVYCRGLFAFISGTPPWTVGTLPVGFRPLNSSYWATIGTASPNQSAFLLGIESNGVLSLQQGSPNWSGTYASMQMVEFQAVG